MSSGRDNAIVALGDIHYLWSLCPLISSAREAGIREQSPERSS